MNRCPSMHPTRPEVRCSGYAGHGGVHDHDTPEARFTWQDPVEPGRVEFIPSDEMTPARLAEYLAAVKASGLALIHVEIPGKLVLRSVGTVGAAAADPGQTTSGEPQLDPGLVDLLNRAFKR